MKDRDTAYRDGFEAPNPQWPKPALRATSALLVFLLYIAGQFMGGVIYTSFELAAAVLEDVDAAGPLSPEGLSARVSPQSALAVTLGSAFGLAIGAYFVRADLMNRSPFGAACRAGRVKGLWSSLHLGIGISFFYLLLSIFIFPPPSGTETSPLVEMGLQPGLGRLIWIVLTLFLAPFIEEVLFRGILLGGLSRSFGPLWASALSTLLFVSLHIPEGFDYWPALMPIALMSWVATRQRMRWQATGAAVAVHFGYNGVIVVSVLLMGH
ncbi:MAG: lysostaphin resistance A-like protein [Nitrospiria bacterium]